MMWGLMGKLSRWIAGLRAAFTRPADVDLQPTSPPAAAKEDIVSDIPKETGSEVLKSGSDVPKETPKETSKETRSDLLQEAGRSDSEETGPRRAEAEDKPVSTAVDKTIAVVEDQAAAAAAAAAAHGQVPQADDVSTVSPRPQKSPRRRKVAEDKVAAAAATAISPPAQADVVPSGSPDQEEIQRRRALVRTLFNNFWDGIDDKPATFADRLNQAETYLNEQLTARGEPWRLDAATRKMLGLPPRASSS
jgi:hypothetical protein